MRRWYDGGWQNLKKHFNALQNPVRALELSLIYVEGLVFSVLMFVIPLINLWLSFWLLVSSFVITMLYAIWAAWKIKRLSLILAPFPYMVLIYINAWLFLESFFKEVILNRKNLVWFKPERIRIEVT